MRGLSISMAISYIRWNTYLSSGHVAAGLYGHCPLVVPNDQRRFLWLGVVHLQSCCIFKKVHHSGAVSFNFFSIVKLHQKCSKNAMHLTNESASGGPSFIASSVHTRGKRETEMRRKRGGSPHLLFQDTSMQRARAITLHKLTCKS